MSFSVDPVKRKPFLAAILYNPVLNIESEIVYGAV